MKTDLKRIRVNESRFKDDFEALAKIGGTPEGGVNRTTFSDAHLAARRWFRQQIESAGLEFRMDGAGNHSAFLDCGEKNAQTLLVGSHLDSVPFGGRFDGALGVLAALEVLRVIRENEIPCRYHLEAIDFTDEEGTFFPLQGSSALVGKLTPDRLKAVLGGANALQKILDITGITIEGLLAAQRDPDSLAGYLELHIEQGMRLERDSVHIGIVSSIVGIRSYQVNFFGLADHAGTSEMKTRKDAAQGASEFILTVRKTLLSDYPDCVANVGKLSLEPGAFNIVPGTARLALEFRAAETNQLDSLEKDLIQKAREAAHHYNLEIEIEHLARYPPMPMHPAMMDTIQAAADRLALSHTTLASRAGHDAQSLAAFCPSGMIFIPSVEGASHSPREYSTWEDCRNGANVLLHTVLELAASN